MRCGILSGAATAHCKSSAEEVFMNNTKKLVLYALLTAIIVLMGFTPIGYLNIGLIQITFLTIPVIVGAITLGPTGGAICGAVFGATSFIQALMGNPFGMALLGINPLLTVVLCFVPRILMGWLCGLIFRAMKRLKIRYIVGSLSAPVLNTVLFTSGLLLLFGRSEYITTLRAGRNLLNFAVWFVGINGALEAIVCTICGAAIAAVLDRVVRK